MQTMTIDGQEVPVIVHENFLVDLGPTPQSGRETWVRQFRCTLNQIGQRDFGGLPIPVEVLASSSKSGRTVLRVWAPDPVQAVEAARELLDDGPWVGLL